MDFGCLNVYLNTESLSRNPIFCKFQNLKDSSQPSPALIGFCHQPLTDCRHPFRNGEFPFQKLQQLDLSGLIKIFPVQRTMGPGLIKDGKFLCPQNHGCVL
jgi:hypothetical protein